MTTISQLGIWMDHANAHLTECGTDAVSLQSIASEFTHEKKKDGLNKSERLMHNQEQHEQAEYYKKLAEVITHYQSVLLFGPTNAKNELLNIVKADHRFANINIEVKQTDKMTEYEQHAFVRDYFSKA